MAEFALQPVPLDLLERSVMGALDVDHRDGGFAPLRLPLWTQEQYFGPGIGFASACTAGVRLRLLTAARRIRLHATFTRRRMPSQRGRLDLVSLIAEDRGRQLDRADLNEGDVIVHEPDQSIRRVAGHRSVVDLALGGDGSRARTVDVWLPHAAETIIHGAETDAPVDVGEPLDLPRWLHHGSSISHGQNADGPLGPWPQRAARRLGLDLINLGFAGNALLDPFVARAIAAQPADVITLKLGINVVNADAMRARTFVPALHGFLDTVRMGHRATPIAVITAIACPEHETVPGPTRERLPGHFSGTPRIMHDGDGALTLQRTRQLIADVVSVRRRHDSALQLVDGLSLLGPEDAAHLYDDLHPDQAGHELIAERFVSMTKKPETALGTAFASALRTQG
ncbi:MAG TPA: GDSL-type esterase/lipase family protein [Pseudolysinimonas sp.]|nr:GDSL-type esterase/lipase family protein [Pseudolysinimonas sp.]